MIAVAGQNGQLEISQILVYVRPRSALERVDQAGVDVEVIGRGIREEVFALDAGAESHIAVRRADRVVKPRHVEVADNTHTYLLSAETRGGEEYDGSNEKTLHRCVVLSKTYDNNSIHISNNSPRST